MVNMYHSFLIHSDFSLVAKGRGNAVVAARGLLIAVVSPVVEHGLQRVQASAAAVPQL